MNRDTAWYKRMLEKYGTDTAITEVMRQNSNKSKRNPKGIGGFNTMDTEKARELQSKGGHARAAKIRAEEQSQVGSQDSNQED